MGELFPNQYYGIEILKHVELPILLSHDFDFYRCVQFDARLYGKTVSELHSGNLRMSRKDNRYSDLFPGQKLSYWADSPLTSRCEVKKWGANCDLRTFCAYDDESSLMTTVYPREDLKIVDGIHFGFDRILKKLDQKIELSNDEKNFIEQIALESPDCLAYKSEARKKGICFLFFEHGFRKLSLRRVYLNLGTTPGKARASVYCAVTSDFMPSLESYGYCFLPKARTSYKKEYENSEEYLMRKQVKEYLWEMRTHKGP